MEDSKCIKEIDVDFDNEDFLPIAENVSMYVLETKQNDFECIIVCSNNRNLYIFNTQGDVNKSFSIDYQIYSKCSRYSNN